MVDKNFVKDAVNKIDRFKHHLILSLFPSLIVKKVLDLWFSIIFIVACAVNIGGSLIFTKFFCGKLIFTTYPGVFSKEGFIGIILWGLAYLSISFYYDKCVWIVLVFTVEKFVYVVYWILFLVRLKREPSLFSQLKEDPVAAIFLCLFGAVDALFMIFFAAVFIATISLWRSDL